MASPFRVFRKNQKMLIASLGVAAIFAFVIGDPLLSLLGVTGGRRGAENPVVATWDGGDLRRSELERHSRLRQACRVFLENAREMGMNVTGSPPRVPPLIGKVTLSGTVDIILLAEQAKRMGFVVSDKMINRYLGQLTQNKVEEDQLTALLRAGRFTSDAAIFDVLRTEMLATEYVRTYRFSGEASLPNDRWNSWKQLNDSIQLEIVPVAVASFLVEIEDPSDTELQDFYNKYRGHVKQPAIIANTELETPEPGFMAPRTVALEFIKADFDTFVTRASDEVTEEQIVQYYEENKKDFILVELEQDSDSSPSSATESNEASAVDGDKADDPASGQNDSKADSTESSEAKDTTEAPADESPADESPADGADDDVPADTAPSDKGPSDKGPSDTENSSASTRRGSAFRLASLAQDDDNTESDSIESDGVVGDGEQPKAPRSDPLPSATLGEVNDDDPGADESDKTEHQPLHEVTDFIRKQIARSLAAERIAKALEEPIRVARNYSARRTAWEAEQAALAPEEKPDEQPPTPPSLEALANEHGLTYEKTALLPFQELRETAIGKCVVNQNRQYVATVAFQRPTKYEPHLAVDMDISRYLVWKTDDAPEHEVALDDIRDQVIRAWKMSEARKLALEKAGELAADATERGESLQKIFAESDQYSVTQTDPFTLFTVGSAFQEQLRLRLSDVDGVDGAGPEFLEKVFQTKPGDVTVATNHAQTFAYVVRFAGREKSLSELHSEFMRSIGDRFSQAMYLRIGQVQGQRAFASLIQQTRQALNLRAPNQ